MAINNSINTLNLPLNIYSGSGNISIGTDSASKVITIGNTTGSTSITIDSGTGSIAIGTSIAKTITIGNTTGATQIILLCGTGGILYPYQSVSTSSITIVSGQTYIINNGASLVTLTLPSTLVAGDLYIIAGYGSGGWKIAQNAGQQIRGGTSVQTTVGVGGSLSSSNRYNCVKILAIASTTAVVQNFSGTLTYV